jgi:hypothetical protein
LLCPECLPDFFTIDLGLLQIRSEEIKLLSKTALIKTINLCVVFAVPPVLGLVIFGTYVFNVGAQGLLTHKFTNPFYICGSLHSCSKYMGWQ